MIKDQNDIYYEFKKRPQGKQLSFNEFAQLREIDCKYFKSDPIFLELLKQYCQDSKFQIRVCEKSFILTTIVPLMNKYNPLDVIVAASQCLQLLSQNIETHEKILKSGALKTIAMHIKDNIYFELTKSCIQILSNLCQVVSNYSEILQNVLHKQLVCKYLDVVDYETQKYILQILISICKNVKGNYYYQDMITILSKKKYCSPLARAIVSPNQEVCFHSIQLFILILNQPQHIQKLIKYDIPPRVHQAYTMCIQSPINNSVIRILLEIIEKMLLFPEYNKIITEEKYIQMTKDVYIIDNQEIRQLSLSCLSIFCENLETQIKLIQMGILNLMCDILRENKDIKQRRLGLKFISHLSQNHKCIQLLINQGIIDLLIIQLNNQDQESRISSVITISNLSGAPNFHKKLQNINIKSLIHIFESSETNINVLRAAANTLANISLDQAYQSYFLKDPEKSILLRIVKHQEDIQLLMSIVIIFSNIASNLQLNIVSIELLDIFIDLYYKNKVIFLNSNYIKYFFLFFQFTQIIGYIAKVISKFSFDTECRKIIIQRKLTKQFIEDIYRSNNHIKKQLLISIMIMIHSSFEMQQEFIESEGIECLLFFLNVSNNFQIYLSFKCFTLLSRFEKNIHAIVEDDICSMISKNALIRERRILKEGIRFFINIIIYNKFKNSIINRLCWLINEGLRNKDDPECLQLSLFALVLISEKPKFHQKLLYHNTLLHNLSIQTEQNLQQFIDLYSKIMMNLSLNPECHLILLEKGFVRLTNEINQKWCQINNQESQNYEQQVNMHSYILTFACQMLKIENISVHIKKLFDQGIIQILNIVLQRSYEFMFYEIVEAFNIILAESDVYPTSVFQTIEKLADHTYMKQDDETVYIRVYILMSLSNKKESQEYFKDSNIVKLIKHIIQEQQKWSHNIIPNCCTILANISLQPNLLKQILEENLINLIFQIWSEKRIISFTDLVKLLAQITSLPQFKSSSLDENIYPFVIDFLYQQISEQKPNNSLISASLLCVLNMTKNDFGLTQAITQSKIIHLIKQIIQLIKKSFYNQLMICVLMVSNLLIDPELSKQNQEEIIEILRCMKNNVIHTKFQNHQINTGFLKILHNLVIQNYSMVKENEIKKCIELCFSLFQESTDVNLLTYILNIMNHLLQEKQFFEQFKENQQSMNKLSDQFLSTIINPYSQDSKLRFSLYTFLTNLSFYENNIEFFESFINLEEFLQKFRNLYSASKREEQEALLCFLANLCNIKEIQTLLLKYNKTLYIIKEVLIEHRLDNLTYTSIRLLANLSSNTEFHYFIAQEEILKSLNMIFFHTKTKVFIKEKIQSLLSNVTFTKQTHEILIKNECIRIFELILHRESKIQEISQKHMLNSMIQLGLNPNNFSLIENQVNMVNSLSMVNECEKPLQIKLLKAATNYVVSLNENIMMYDKYNNNNESIQSQIENKLDISREIISCIKSNLESKSSYFINSSYYILNMLVKWEHFPKIMIDYTRLTGSIINIIIYFDYLEMKIIYYQILKDITSNTAFFNNNTAIVEQLNKLYKFNNQILQKLDQNPPLQIKESNRIRAENFIVCFLQILSNCSIFGYQNDDLIKYLISPQIEEHIIHALIFGKNQSYNILCQIICTLSNFYQNEFILRYCYSYSNLFDQLYVNYRKYIRFNSEFEYYIASLINVVLKSAFFNQNKTGLQQFFSKNTDLLATQQQLLKSGSLISNDSESKSIISYNEENKFMFSFFLMILKRGSNRQNSEIITNTTQQGEKSTLYCIANLAYYEVNHKIIFATKIPEYLFKFLANETCIQLIYYQQAIVAFLNLARNKEIYKRIKCEEIFKWFKSIIQVQNRHYVENGIIALILMIDNAKYDDFIIYAVDIVEFLTKHIISFCKINDHFLDRVIILIQKILSIKGMIYILFQSLFQFLNKQNLSEQQYFDSYFKIWELMQNFLDSKECLSYLLKYGFLNIIKQQINYFQDEQLFYKEFIIINLNEKNENNEKSQAQFKIIIYRLKLLSLLLSCIDQIFQKELIISNSTNVKYKLIYSKEKNISTDDKTNRFIYIQFQYVYEIMSKIQNYPSLYQESSTQNILIVCELLFNMSKVLTRAQKKNKQTKFFFYQIIKLQKDKMEYVLIY
ncbi:hypothetical protein IMG5_153470 [Ichthyophthirius multifiliis]|uniref:Uncharacterized protein n=1 Tax=Ichthyophthirius multifiliis TaxID=5932 RepID=G0QZ04_ICHMU|nr:hypothetical protein IMG5_153470 [Ichthyophthirius multifiliis]EGR29575.1 hypothetical protein IMG5_153470 [Ichthyophthirius multifiliis]|eukprot:XP_004030811.1 hypothetical protein IMG5_153470 [Ichthyophthirius multifiliis]